MDKYRVVKRIGVGTYGSAYLVADKRFPDQVCVLKKVKVDAPPGSDGMPLDGREQQRAAPETEVAVLMQLDHPLVLSYVDHFMYKGHLCIVTDYCEAGDLYQMLRARKAPLLEGQILELLAQILIALQYVHSRNILHRDLKTANIFLTKEGTIKLGDFGISRPLNGGLDLASTIIGTPYYMSPEVMSSQPYDFKSDMWSLGCCLYEMMTLKHAFDASDLTSLVLKVMRGEHLPIPDQFSAGLRDLAKQLLSKVPKLRPSPEQCLKSPLLKDYAFRAREKVAWLEQNRATRGRWRSPARVDATGRNGPSFASPGRGGGPMASSPDVDLDRELQQAQERLRRIRVERDALRDVLAQQGANGAAGAGAAGGGGGLGMKSPKASCNGGVPQQQQGAKHTDDPNQGVSSTARRLGRRASQAAGSLAFDAGANGGHDDAGPSASGQQPHGGGGGGGGGGGDQRLRDRSRGTGTGGHRPMRESMNDLHPPSNGLSAGAHGDWGGGGGGPDAAGFRSQQDPPTAAALLTRSYDELPTSFDRRSPPAGGSGPYGGLAGSSTDPKARKEARRQEEIKRREAELLEARKAYFEERRTAEAKKYNLFHTSSIASNAGTASRDQFAAHRSQGRESYSGHVGLEQAAGYQSYGASPAAGGYHSGHSTAHRGSMPCGAGGGWNGEAGVSIDSSDDEDEGLQQAPRRGISSHLAPADPSVMQEFESELVAGPGPGAAAVAAAGSYAVPGRMYDAGGALAERAAALRGYCASALGPQLFELIYGALRRRVATSGGMAGAGAGVVGGGGVGVASPGAGGGSADEVFRQELQSRLGASRMQYVHLIDQLIYFEDCYGGYGGIG